jgi:hypothetical protein
VAVLFHGIVNRQCHPHLSRAMLIERMVFRDGAARTQYLFDGILQN